jgi:succinate dehydrogenase/fumarate reductase cytochrome b subunit
MYVGQACLLMLMQGYLRATGFEAVIFVVGSIPFFFFSFSGVRIAPWMWWRGANCFDSITTAAWSSVATSRPATASDWPPMT